jgi:hypothetical protein
MEHQTLATLFKQDASRQYPATGSQQQGASSGMQVAVAKIEFWKTVQQLLIV